MLVIIGLIVGGILLIAFLASLKPGRGKSDSSGDGSDTAYLGAVDSGSRDSDGGSDSGGSDGGGGGGGGD